MYILYTHIACLLGGSEPSRGGIPSSGERKRELIVSEEFDVPKLRTDETLLDPFEIPARSVEHDLIGGAFLVTRTNIIVT